MMTPEERIRRLERAVAQLAMTQIGGPFDTGAEFEKKGAPDVAAIYEHVRRELTKREPDERSS